MAHFTTKGALTEVIAEKTFRKERRRLQVKHLWMEVKLSWDVLSDRMYTVASTRKFREQLYELLFNRAARGSQKNPYKEKAYRGPAHKEVQAWWEQCQEWMLYYKFKCAPLVQDIKGFCVHSGWCIHGILRKAMPNKRGLPAQATTTLAGCERPAWAGRCRSGHDGHWPFTWMAWRTTWRTTSWWKRCNEGLRGARVVSSFLRVWPV